MTVGVNRSQAGEQAQCGIGIAGPGLLKRWALAGQQLFASCGVLGLGVVQERRFCGDGACLHFFLVTWTAYKGRNFPEGLSAVHPLRFFSSCPATTQKFVAQTSRGFIGVALEPDRLERRAFERIRRHALFCAASFTEGGEGYEREAKKAARGLEAGWDV